MTLIEHLKGRSVTHDYFQSLEFDEKDLVFFIMPFKKSYIYLFENYLKPLIRNEFQMEAEIAKDRFIVSGFTQKIWQQICESRIVIADVTGWNANVLYELGLAHALSKKCIIIARGKLKLPSDLGHIDSIKYDYRLFKKDINVLEKRLISAIRQVLDRGKVKITDFSNWQQSRGPWSCHGDVLELSAPSIAPDAFYVWNPTPFSNSIDIKFRLKFVKKDPADFRIALFAESPLETYSNSNHLLLLVPWEGGDHRADGLVNGEVIHFFRGEKIAPPSVGQQFYYDIRIDAQYIIVKIDGMIVLQETTQNVRQFIVKPSYWGFSSVGGYFQVSELETNIT